MLPDGVICVLKPPGMTSHGVVAWVRRRFGVRRVGHAGTLDPGAAGLLLVLVGGATRIAEYLAPESKEYVTEVSFGTETDTDDCWGEVIRRGRTDVSGTEIDRALEGLTGTIMQVPPRMSALKYRGRPLYKWAREGRPVTPEARPVEIHSIERLPLHSLPARAMLRVRCGGGTYIRALCRDLGRLVASAAHMSFLVRTASGSRRVAEAWTLEELDAWDGEEPGPVVDIGLALRSLPEVSVDDPVAVSHGRGPHITDDLPDGLLVRLHDADGRFLAVARADRSRGRLVIDKVFTGGEGRG